MVVRTEPASGARKDVGDNAEQNRATPRVKVTDKFGHFSRFHANITWCIQDKVGIHVSQ